MSDEKDYKKDLFDDLKDPSYAIGYLIAANKEGDEALCVLLKTYCLPMIRSSQHLSLPCGVSAPG